MGIRFLQMQTIAELYKKIDLKIGDKVLIKENNSKDNKDHIKRWTRAVVLQRYPTYILFKADLGYNTCLMNVDINERRLELECKR